MVWPLVAAMLLFGLGETVLPTLASAGEGTAVTAPDPQALAVSTTTSVEGFRIEGFADSATLLVSIGLPTAPTGTRFALPTNGGLTLSHGYAAWSNLERVSFTGTQAAANAALASLTVTTTAATGPVEVAVSAMVNQSGVTYNPNNGHFYEFVSESNISWHDASDAATQRKLLGRPGYLVTITSGDIQNLVTTNIAGASNIWVDGSDEALEGRWLWTNGPEAGQEFWRAACVENEHSTNCPTDTSYSSIGTPFDDAYTNWCNNEPNNFNGVEHNIVTNWDGGTCWNDLSATSINRIQGYVVEYSPNYPTDQAPGFEGVVSASADLTVNDTLSWVTPQLLPAATIGEHYDVTLEVVAGTGSVSFEVTGGELPDWLDLEGAELTGTPTESSHLGGASFDITATDELGSDERNFGFEVVGSAPSVTTGVPAPVRATSVDITGTVTDAGSFPVTERGFVIATGSTPTLSDRVVDVGTDGDFQATIAGLAPDTAYHLRAYATNAVGTGYGAEQVVTTSAGVRWLDAALPPLVRDVAYTLDFGALVTDTVGTATFTLDSGSLPPGLDLATDGTLSGTTDAVVGSVCSFDVEVEDAGGDSSAVRSFHLEVQTYGSIRTTDYGTPPEGTTGGAYFWRGYSFQVSERTVVTHLVGGGNHALAPGKVFKGALFSANTSAEGAAVSPAAVLAEVTFPAATVNQVIALDEHVVLEPGTWYYLAQGSVAGTVLHYYVDALPAADLVDASQRIESWMPAIADPAGQAYIWSGGNHEPTDSTILNRAPSTTPAKPALGFQYLTTTPPPAVETLAVDDSHRRPLQGQLATGSADAAVYIQHGTNPTLSSGSTSRFLGVRSAGQVFGIEDLTGITAETYYYRARANNDGGAANGAIQSFTTTPQSLALALPELTAATASVEVVATATGGTGVSFTSQTPSVCSVAGTTVTPVAAGTCTLSATHPGGWDGHAEVFHRQVVGTVSASVSAVPVRITGSFTVADRPYDRTTAATPATSALTLHTDDVHAGHSVALGTVTVAFVTATAGEDVEVVITGATLTGADAGRYVVVLDDAPTTTAAITPVPVSVSGSFTVADRVYDGTTTATVTGHELVLTGVLAGDTVPLTPVARFVDQTVGDDREVVLTAGSVLGGDGANYVLDLTGAPTATASITPRTLSVTGASTVARPYDGTTAVAVTGAQLAGVVAGDDVGLASATAGTAAAAVVGTHAVTTLMGLTGADAANYELSQPTLSVTIAPRVVSVTGLEVVERVYDGTTAATVTGGVLTNVVAGDRVTLTGHGTASFAAPDVGEHPVTVAFALTGAHAAQYSLTPPPLAGRIIPAPATLRFAGGMAWYVGEAGSPRVETDPPGLGGIVLTYADGAAPTTPGSFRVTATLTDPNHVAAPVSALVTVLAAPSDPDPHLDQAPEYGPVTWHDDDGEPVVPALPPATARYLEDGVDHEVTVRADRDALHVDTAQVRLALRAQTTLGRPLDLDPRGSVRLTQGGIAETWGDGFAANARAEVWLFSEPRYLGMVAIGADGAFHGRVPIPADITVGEHTLQVNAPSPDGRLRSLSLGILIDPTHADDLFVPAPPAQPQPVAPDGSGDPVSGPGSGAGSGAVPGSGATTGQPSGTTTPVTGGAAGTVIAAPDAAGADGSGDPDAAQPADDAVASDAAGDEAVGGGDTGGGDAAEGAADGATSAEDAADGQPGSSDAAAAGDVSDDGSDPAAVGAGTEPGGAAAWLWWLLAAVLALGLLLLAARRSRDGAEPAR